MDNGKAVNMSILEREQLSHYQEFKLILEGATKDNVVQRLQGLAVPFMHSRCATWCCGNQSENESYYMDPQVSQSFLVRWLKEISTENSFALCSMVLKEGLRDVRSKSFFRDENEAIECALQCIYRCTALDSWNAMAGILSKLPQLQCSGLHAESLSKRIKAVECHIKAGRLLAYYQVPKPMSFFLDVNSNEKDVKQLIQLVLSKFSRRQPACADDDWVAMWHHMQILRDKAFPFLDQEYMLTAFCKGLLKAGKFALARNYLKGTASVAFPFEKKANIVIQAAREYFLSASSLAWSEVTSILISSLKMKKTALFLLFALSHLGNVGHIDYPTTITLPPLILMDEPEKPVYGVSIAWGGAVQALADVDESLGLGIHAIFSIAMIVFLILILSHIYGQHKNKSESRSLKVQCKRKSFLNEIISVSQFGTVIFKGIYEWRPTAIKKMDKVFYNYSSIKKHVETYVGRLHLHRNIIRLYEIEEDESFIYIASELGICSLEDIIEEFLVFGEDSIDYKNITDFKLWRSPDHNPSDTMLYLMRDMVEGLYHMHANNRLHKRLTLRNVLITEGEKVDGDLCAKLCDIGMDLKLSNSSVLDLIPSDYSLWEGWLPPEVLIDNQSSKASDIFSLGCILYYCLVGTHAYGGVHERINNIINERPPDYDNILRVEEAMDLLQKMLVNSALRIEIKEVRSHPFFWAQKDRILFLVACSDEFEDRKKYVLPLTDLEARANEVFSMKTQWYSSLDQNLYAEAIKYRRYNVNRVQDLLRFIRNHYSHYSTLNQSSKQLLGSKSEGCYTYFENKFPKLLMVVYMIAKGYCNSETWFVDVTPGV